VAKGSTSEERLSFGWIVTYPLFAVLAVMVYLSAEELSQPAPPVVVAVKAPPLVDSPEWSEKFPDRVEIVQAAVMAAPLVESFGAKTTSQSMQGSSAFRWPHRVLELRVDRAQRPQVEASLGELHGVDPGVNVVWEETFNGGLILVGVDGLLTHTVRVYWNDRPERPRVGLVVSALGDDLRVARAVLELEDPVSVAVRPFRPFSAQVAELAKMFDRELLLDWRAAAAERHGLDAALGTVPGAVGVAVAGDGVSDEELQSFRERGLFTIRADVEGATSAITFAIPPGAGWQRSVDALLTQVREGGRAIAIAQASGADELSRLRALLAQWRQQGDIEVVGVSKILDMTREWEANT